MTKRRDPKARRTILAREIIEVLAALPVETQKEIALGLRRIEVVEGKAERETITLAEIASTYGVSRRTLERYIASGKLSATKIGRTYHVTVANLEAWLDGRPPYRTP